MNDLIALIPHAAMCAGVVWMAWGLDRPSPRRPKVGGFGIRRIVEVR